MGINTYGLSLYNYLLQKHTKIEEMDKEFMVLTEKINETDD